MHEKILENIHKIDNRKNNFEIVERNSRLKEMVVIPIKKLFIYLINSRFITIVNTFF